VNYDLENKSILPMNFSLPGGRKQLEHFLEQNFLNGKSALIIGPASMLTVKTLINNYSEIFIISDNYESLINIRANLKETDSVNIKMMDYAHTDFKDNYFDLIYSQGSVSVPERKNILKEIKRIIINDGIFSVGEIVSLKEPVAGFVKDIWEQSGLEPLPLKSINQFYASTGFEVVSEKDLSNTLKDYYEKIRHSVLKAGKEENKKLFTRMKHESNAYLKLGGDKYIGFKSLILRKLH
jgi:SAM-dependent methyltransferase